MNRNVTYFLYCLREEKKRMCCTCRRILQANTLLESSEIEEYHENRGFQESKGDLEAAARQRKPVPNIF